MLHEFKDIMTTTEAAVLWGKSSDTIKHLCTGIKDKFPPQLTEEEARKSGKVWLVTREGMERIYGPAPEK